MPKILITGNGFDLGFNLPTSYDDFIQILSHIEKEDSSSFEDIYSNTKNFEGIKANYSRDISFKFEQLDNLRERLKESLWFQFFKTECQIDTWIDFENRIDYTLKILVSSTSLLREKIFSVNPVGKNLPIHRSDAFNNNIVAISVLDFFGIIKKYSGYNWKFNKGFLIEKYELYINIDIAKITDFLLNELESFKIIFNEYFTLFVLPLYNNKLKNFDKKLFNSIDYHFTFNYTPTFEKFFDSKAKTNFLHGKISSDENNIVLGINDIGKDIEDRGRYFPFTKYYQKLNNETDFFFLNEIEGVVKNSYSTNYVFFFWGHSLDSSDEDYINEVFDFVKEQKGQLNKIIVIYHSNTSKANLLHNLLNIRGKDDIVRKMREKNLIFCKTNSEALKEELERDIIQRLIF